MSLGSFMVAHNESLTFAHFLPIAIGKTLLWRFKSR